MQNREPAQDSSRLRSVIRHRSRDGVLAVSVPPRFGISPNPAAIRKYLVKAEIKAKGEILYRAPAVE